MVIPDRFLVKTEGDRVDSLIDSVYDNFEASHASLEYLAGRAIVCPTNIVVDAINARIAARVHSEEREYLSADRVAPGSEQVPNVDLLYTEDILNSISQPNYPEHRLVLKVGMPVILLRNLNQAMGLCNGTRLLITRLCDCVFEATVMTGLAAGQSVCIPRIVLNASNPEWPFVFQRRQFPVRVCYAVTINKSQGQTLKKVGLYLQSPVLHPLPRPSGATSGIRAPLPLPPRNPRFCSATDGGVPAECREDPLAAADTAAHMFVLLGPVLLPVRRWTVAYG